MASTFRWFTERMGKEKSKVKIRSDKKLRVLVCSSDPAEARRVVYYLNSTGFEARAAHNTNDLKAQTLSWKPSVCIVDLLLPGSNAFKFLQFQSSEPSIQKQKIATIVVSSHNQNSNIEEAFKRGAADYIIRPLKYPDLLQRVILHCRETHDVDDNVMSTSEQAAQWQMTEVLLTQAMSSKPIEDILFNLSLMAAKKVGGIRCSVIRTLNMFKGVVIASSDDPTVKDLELDLNKYPEVRLVVRTGKAIVIDDLSNSKSLAGIRSKAKSIDFNSMIVAPIYYNNTSFGAISMRLPDGKKSISDADVQFLDMLAKLISLTLSAKNLDEISKFGLISA